jgi:hypothetical protein
MVFVTLPEQHAMETNNTATEVEPQNVKEDEIDVILSKESGTIERQRDAQLCHHGPQGKCVHCLPIDVGTIVQLETMTRQRLTDRQRSTGEQIDTAFTRYVFSYYLCSHLMQTT